MAKETLYCETGNHKWTRESTRGRKPTTCPKHPRVVHVAQSNNAGEAIRTLHCEIGNHSWERPAQRGRVPANCPEHAPVKVAVTGSKTQTLHCEIGNHSWERPSQRGIKPHNCPEHKPVKVAAPSTSLIDPAAGTVMRVLHCEIGNHEWKRASQRGRVPVNCPEHSATPPRAVPVRVISDAFPVADIPEDELPLVEVEGEYEPETTEQEQRELLTAAFNPPPKRGPGRPKLYDSKEEQEAAALAKSRARVDELEISLRANGTHISQQTPYKLYMLENGIAGTDSATYRYVRDFSPLAREQFLNRYEDRFLAKIYYFERDGERVEI